MAAAALLIIMLLRIMVNHDSCRSGDGSTGLNGLKGRAAPAVVIIKDRLQLPKAAGSCCFADDENDHDGCFHDDTGRLMLVALSDVNNV